MSGAAYGGDEVGAIVFDVGALSTKVGYAGEDSPKGVFPTVVGCVDAAPLPSGAMDTGPDTVPAPRKFYAGASSALLPRANMELRSPLGPDNLVTDWDLYEQLLLHSYSQVLCTDATNHPVMISEVAWSTPSQRAKLAELMFEKIGAPALYFGKDAVLSAFASGRHTALVVNIGAALTSVVPVYEGHVVHSGVQRSPLGGHALTRCYRALFDSETRVDVVPSYNVAHKTPVEEGEPAKWVAKTRAFDVCTSYHDFMVDDIVRDFQAHVSRVSAQAYDPSDLCLQPPTTFEFPNGFTASLGLERYRVPELLLQPNSPYAPKNADGTLLVDPTVSPPLSAMLVRSVGVCDVDIAPSLWGNVLPVGGVALTPGLTQRLSADLGSVVPQGTKFKIVAPLSNQDRLFSAWVGGSILASLGTFQQMWVSKAEYAEHGPDVFVKRCL